MNIKPGDVIFVMHHDNIISKIMAWFMSSKWSHSAIVRDVSLSDVYLSETSDFCVNINVFKRYQNDKNTSFVVLRHPDWSNIIHPKENEIRESLDLLNGKTYGYLQLLSFAIKILIGKLGIKIPHFIRLGTICCQVVSLTLHKIKNSGLDIRDPKSYDTQEMYDLLINNGWQIIAKKEN